MKKILFLAAFALGALSAPAAAGIIATASNNSGGGSFLLTDRPADCPEGTLRIVTTSPKLPPFYGCYFIPEGSPDIWVRWEDGDVRTYPIVMFKMVKDSK